MYSHSQGIIRHTIKDSYEKKSEGKSEKKSKEKINKGFSSKTQCKHVSNDNFIKFQWPWIL